MSKIRSSLRGSAGVTCALVGSMVASIFATPLPVSAAPAANAVASSRSHIRVAAAADLKFALEKLKSQFQRSHSGTDIEIVTGSSGQFEQQIEKGAPFDLFLSADSSYPKTLSNKKMTVSPPEQYGVGTLVLWSRSADLTGGLSCLKSATIKKIAIGNPDHAPYGRAAKDALVKAHVWEAVKSKLVLGDSIGQAAQFAMTGAADVGLIALALAQSPEFKSSGHYVAIPEATPLEQSLVVLKDNAVAKEFASYILGREGQAVLKSFGFRGDK